MSASMHTGGSWMLRAVVALLAAAVMVATGGSGARAAPAEDMARARQACAAFELEPCIQQSRALLKRTDLGRAERVELLEQLGSALAVLGDPAGAEAAFTELLALDAGHALPADAPPKILTVWKSARAEHDRRRAETDLARLEAVRAAVKVTPPELPEHKGGTPLRVVVRVDGPDGAVDRVFLHHRREQATGDTSQPMERSAEGAWEAVIPAALLNAPEGGSVQWWVDVLDAEGRVLQGAGTADTPRGTVLLAGVELLEPAEPPRPVGNVAGGLAGALLATAVTGTVGTVLGLSLLSVLGAAFPPAMLLAAAATAAVGAGAAAAGWVVFQRAGRFRAPLLPALLTGILVPLGGFLAGAPCAACGMGIFAYLFSPAEVASEVRSDGGFNLYTALLVLLLPAVLVGGSCATAAGLASPPLVAAVLWATGREMVEGEREFVPDLVRASPRSAPLEDEGSPEKR